MKRSRFVYSFVAVVPLVIACSDQAALPTALLSSGNGNGNVSSNVSAQRNGEHAHTVTMMDACDPTTFNAEIGDGACTRDGGITFNSFIEQLTRLQKVGSWHFAPDTVHARVGDLLEAVNRGGEAHTFTEVEEFGGGFIPDLNALSGNPVPAPECLNFASIVFIAPGDKSSEEIDESGTELYQCCLHPWMRAVIKVR